MRVCLFLGLVVCLGTPLYSAEYAVLNTGFRLKVTSHERVGETVRLQTPEGVMEVPAAQVEGFEFEADPPPPPPPPPPPAPVIAAAPAPAAPPRKLTPKELVDQAAARAGLPKAIVHSVAKAESAYRTDALSKKGAIGIMQLMPGTASQLNADPRNPEQNVDAGARYLRELLQRYDGDVAKALAAYNAGPGAVDKYKGVPPYAETQTYVDRVLRDYIKNTKVAAPAVPASVGGN